MKSRGIWTAAATTALCVCYILSRHDVLGQWHFMKQWPLCLFIFGLIVIVIAAVIFSKKLMISTVTGYITGFFLAMLFNADGADQSGARTNNAWQIWMISFLAVILAGTVSEIAGKHMRKTRLSGS